MAGSTPITTIWTYNSGVSFTQLNGDGIDPATGNIYAVDELTDQVVVFDSTGNYLAVFGNAQLGVTNPSHPLGSYPTGVAVNSAGTTVYVVGNRLNTIYVYSIGGLQSNPVYTYLYNFGNIGSGSVTLNGPINLRVDGNGNVWVADTNNQRLAEYTGTGNYITSFHASAIDPNFSPVDVLVDGSGNVYGVDSNAGVVVKFNSSGVVLGQFGKGVLTSPQGIATDGLGNFYVTNTNPQQIVVFQ